MDDCAPVHARCDGSTIGVIPEGTGVPEEEILSTVAATRFRADLECRVARQAPGVITVIDDCADPDVVGVARTGPNQEHDVTDALVRITAVTECPGVEQFVAIGLAAKPL